MKNFTEINVPSGHNSIFSNQKETPKEISENNPYIKKNTNKNSMKRFSNDSLKLYQNNENIMIFNDINNIQNEEKEKNKLFTKSSTYNNNQNNNTYYINNINDNQNNNINIQKARTCRENENINKASLTIRLNNLGQNHLETVLEAISEASNSKIDSSELSEDEENEVSNKNNIKNETKESGKIKEEFNKFPSEHKNQGTGTDTRIYDSEYNLANKKSLYFLSSEKTK